MLARYMQVVWLYVIGILVIFVGIYLLMLNSGPVSFIIMLGGLGVSAVGSAHGRRMRMMGELDMEQLMSDGGFQTGEPEKPKAEDFKGQEEAGPPPQEQPEEAPPEEVQRPPETGGLRGIFRRKPVEQPLEPQDILELEMRDIKSGKIVPTEADIIEFVCPMCGAANEERNYFCFKCGNRLRRKTPGEDDAGTHLKVDPGTIEIVENQRVAKVVICPKCNVPNKMGDKFCWSCGKKIRSESKEAMKIEMEEPVLPKRGKGKRKKKKPI